MQSHLKRAGVRPINNVVDITNYIMLLTAQPLHAFDFDKVAQDGVAHIVVRRPHDGETMTLLDGKQIKPHKDAILICNQAEPIALGGVMGGGNSEVDANTTRVILEAATFDMYNIRRTSMTHGIFTDAVTRFNKGQPAAQLLPVLHKALAMFEELVGAQVASEVVDSHPQTPAPVTVNVSTDFINARLGSSFTADGMAKLLRNVECDVNIRGDELRVGVPFWRTDIEIAEDVVEEVGRLFGFNQLPLELPTRSIRPVAPEPGSALRTNIRQALSRAGANELLTYSFVHGDLLAKVGQDTKHAFKLKNALSPDLQYYRLSLTPSLLDKVHPNVKAGFDRFAVFEAGKTHIVGMNGDEDLPREYERLSLVYADNKPAKDTGAAYFQAKRYLTELLDGLGITYCIEPVDFELTQLIDQLEAAPFDLARSAYIRIDDAVAGFVGELKPTVRQKLKLPVHTAAFELDLQRLLATDRQSSSYQPLSRYPSVSQDISLRVQAGVQYQTVLHELASALQQHQPADVRVEISPLDIYQTETDESVHMTYRVTVVSMERTLQAVQVNQLLDEVAAELTASIGAVRV
ncbi:phenylalanine--tRNA ligase subunit beta [Patescibacteria group bacterium]|nr:MAG: phenylalanine--tRNA ligase subunit beta [Patescibacteria group bacterium]